MVLDRASRHDEAVRDLGVPHTLAEQVEHLELTRGEIRRVVPRGAIGATRHATRSALAQALREDARGRAGAEAEQLGQALPQRVVVVRVSPGKRRLVGAAELVPE